MGVTSVETMDDVIRSNQANYESYKTELRGIPGVSVIDYTSKDKRNYHYIVLCVDPAACPLTRDDLVEVLHAENVLARKYFWPGCHRMQPYQALFPNAHLLLPHTERLAAQMIVLPTGQTVSGENIGAIGGIIKTAVAQADMLKTLLRSREGGMPCLVERER